MFMEFEGKLDTQMHSNMIYSRHKRSKSDFDKRNGEENLDSLPRSIHHAKQVMGKPTGDSEIKNKPLPEASVEGSWKHEVMGKPTGDSEIKNKTLPEASVEGSWKHEILQLEKRLQDQLTMRCALEKALGYSSSAVCSSNEISMPKHAKELIREIAILELEVGHLEQYLLSLYRKAFDQQTSTVSPPASGHRSKKLLNSQSKLLHESAKLKISSKRENSRVQSSQTELPQKCTTNSVNEDGEIKCQGKLLGPSVHRSHSSLSYRAVCSARISPSEETLARALHSFHSQPLSFLEEEQNANSGLISLADYLETSTTDHVPETPNKLSEELIRCMGAIYCKLADPPLVYHGLSSSPTSSFSTMSALSPQYLGDVWSPGYKRESTLDSRLINPFQVEGLKEFSGPYNAMVEVPPICRDRRRLKDVEDMLHNYKLILGQLEIVDPRKLKIDEKLAFWINVHNAIIMHAYIEYGIPEGNVKRASLLIKAMCTVGGRSISAAMIQGYILRSRTHCTGQWLRTLLYPRLKHIKGGDKWQAYAIEQPEPLLHFALCSGSHSDPAVRIYNCDRLSQQLESAKEEYIRASVGIWKEQKILLPKLIDSYAKDTKLSSQRLVDMVQCYLPETLRMAIQRCQHGKSKNIIEWVPHNFNFRYLLSRQLAFPQI